MPSAAGWDVPVAAIVVTYFPDTTLLPKVLAAASRQASMVIVVDNGTQGASRGDLDRLVAEHGAVLIDFGTNRGIAAAHNAGLLMAASREMRQALLLDHDSEPASGMVARLQQAMWRLRSDGLRVAAVGPAWVDGRSGRRGVFHRIEHGRILRVKAEPADALHSADFLISSGTLLSLDAVDDVGPMREELFIDHVDTEWCLRARLRGWRLYGVSNAVLRHSLGDATQRVWLGRWRKVALHAPLRNYYEVRNAVFLLRVPGAPLSWQIAQLTRLVQVLVFNTTLASDRAKRLQQMLRGLRDGVRGRGGPAPSP